MAGQGALYLVGRVMQVLAYVVVLPVVTRTLTVEAFGLVAVALVVQQAVAAVAPLGLTSVVAWDLYERHPDGRTRSSRLVVSTTIITVAIVLLVAVSGPVWSQIFSGVGYVAAFGIAVWTVVPVTIHAACLSVLQAQGRPVAFSVSMIVATVGGQLLGLAMIRVDPTASAYLSGLLVGWVAGAIAAAVAIPLNSWRPSPMSRLRASLRHGAPVVPHLLGFMVLAVGDRVVIERVLGFEEAARYQTAYLVGALGMAVLMALNKAWAPAVYAEARGVWGVLVASTAHVYTIGLALTAAIAFTAPLVLSVVAPSSYNPRGLTGVVALVVASVVPNVTYLAGVHVLFKEKRTAPLVVIMPAGAAVNIGLNVLLVPRFGLEGAAVATLVGYLVIAVGATYAAGLVASVPWQRHNEMIAYAGAVAVTVAAILVPTEGFLLWVRVLLGAAAASALLFRVAAAMRSGSGIAEVVTGAATRPSGT